MLGETISFLVTDRHGIYVDCTAGGGGHLGCLAGHLAEDALIIAIDKDKDALQAARKTLDYSNIRFIHADFRELLKILQEEGVKQVDGIMIDLGVSSFQLDIAERGFSFHKDALLDMRMDSEQELRAWDVVNKFSEEDLAKIFFEYGEERYARQIAKKIADYRKKKIYQRPWN